MHFQLFLRKFLISMLLKNICDVYNRDIRSIHNLFINKEISKAITTRYSLKNSLLQNRNKKNWKLFSKQRSKGVSLRWKSKKDNFTNLNEKKITDNKRFWKTVKHFFSKKNSSSWINKFHQRRKQLFINKMRRNCKRTE